jgi:hypothetical protein
MSTVDEATTNTFWGWGSPASAESVPRSSQMRENAVKGGSRAVSRTGRSVAETGNPKSASLTIAEANFVFQAGLGRFSTLVAPLLRPAT